jgi:hypothetical protein
LSSMKVLRRSYLNLNQNARESINLIKNAKIVSLSLNSVTRLTINVLTTSHSQKECAINVYLLQLFSRDKVIGMLTMFPS